ncbi:MAG: zinc ribbon domain-containing protein [Nitrospinae bacterium]|nr:zinc ribbon domain-containing protein [Nitrospinota bacterium]
MPIFEYNCLECEKDFEMLLYGGSEDIRCPYCGKDKVKKILSTFSSKSGDRFTSSSGGNCSSCSTRSPSACSTCR